MKRSKKFLVAIATLVIVFPILELGLRAANFRHRPTDLPPMIWNPKQDKLMRNEDYLFRSKAGQLWEPNPGAGVPWAKPETINERAYRGPLRSFTRTPGVLRVVTMGDSSTFGHSVKYEDSYTAQLEAELNSRGVKAEVICGGVIGHSILQGLQRYDQLTRKFNADVVVLAYGAINEHIPGPGALSDDEKIANSFTQKKYEDTLARRLRRLRIGHLAAWIADSIVEPKTVKQSVDNAKLRKQQNKEYGVATWPGVRHVEPPRFWQAIKEFHGKVQEDGSQTLFISMPRRSAKEKIGPILLRYTEILTNYAAKNDVPIIDPRSTFLANEAAGNPPSELLVDFVHPTPAGHKIIADQLADKIQQLQRDKGLKPRE